MRTTIRLDDRLLAEAKQYAAESGRTLTGLIEDALREVADTTGGTYFRASDADQLQGVLADLPRHVDRQTREVEVSAGLAGLAVLALLAAVGLSARWRVFP